MNEGEVMTFGERLASYRTQKGYNQREFAAALGITPTRLNYWEKDKREPDVSMIKNIATLLDISTDDLIGVEKKSPVSSDTGDEKDIMPDELIDFLICAGIIKDNKELSEKDHSFLQIVRGIIDLWSKSNRP